MFRPLSVVVLLMLAAAQVSCEAEMEGAEGSLGLQLAPMSNSCSTALSSLVLGEYGVIVADTSVQPTKVLVDDTFSGNSKTISVKAPEGDSLELSLLGWSAGKDAKPLAFARAKNLTVQADKTTEVAMALNMLGGYTCAKAPNSAANIMLPTITSLPDGRVLIAGGYTKVNDLGDRFEIYGPSKLAYIFNPETNTLKQVNNTMNHGRGAHSAIYLPQKQQVLLVGGSESMLFKKDSLVFPLYFDKSKVGAVGATYEIFDTTREEFIPYSAWEDRSVRMVLNKNRVMPVLSLNMDGTVLVTGGGLWPTPDGLVETDNDYRFAEFYRPKSQNYPDSGFQDTNKALAMSTLRSGHASALLDVKDRLAFHIFWGGNSEGAVAEIYQESSGQLDGNYGFFKPVTFIEGNNYAKKPFFATLTPLASRRFLLAGGVHNAAGRLRPPSAGDSFLLIFDSSHRISFEQIDGLHLGRFGHTASSPNNRHVVIAGGFIPELVNDDTIFSIKATPDIRVFDLKTKTFSNASPASEGRSRAGHGAVALNNDCIFFVGGVERMGASLQVGSNIPHISAEIFCPSFLCPESHWNDGCYLN